MTVLLLAVISLDQKSYEVPFALIEIQNVESTQK